MFLVKQFILDPSSFVPVSILAQYFCFFCTFFFLIQHCSKGKAKRLWNIGIIWHEVLFSKYAETFFISFLLSRSLARNFTTYTSKSAIIWGRGIFATKHNSEWNVAAPRSRLESSVSYFLKVPALFSSILYYVRVSAAWNHILYLLVRSQFITSCESMAGLHQKQSGFVWSWRSVGVITAC